MTNNITMNNLATMKDLYRVLKTLWKNRASEAAMDAVYQQMMNLPFSTNEKEEDKINDVFLKASDLMNRKYNPLTAWAVHLI